MGKPSAEGQLTRPTQSFILSGSIKSSMLKSYGCYHYSGGTVWWTLTRWRQVWSVCSVTTVWLWSILDASEASFSQWGAIQIQLPLPFIYTRHYLYGITIIYSLFRTECSKYNVTVPLLLTSDQTIIISTSTAIPVSSASCCCSRCLFCRLFCCCFLLPTCRLLLTASSATCTQTNIINRLPLLHKPVI